jgi:hypothetical protein
MVRSNFLWVDNAACVRVGDSPGEELR